MPANWNRCGMCGRPIKAKSNMGKTIKIFLILLVVLVAYINRAELLSIIGFDESASDFISSLMSDDKNLYISSQNTIEPIAWESEDRSHTPGNIKNEEKATPDNGNVYDLIQKALLSTSNNILIPLGYDSDEVFAAIREIVLNEPEILFYKSCTYRSDGFLTFKYSKPKDFIKKSQEELQKKANDIISSIIKPNMTDFEKELAIHDHIINNCKYDIENFEAGTIPPESHSAYGALIEGTAVCEGYAKAMKLLMDRAGVDSLVVTGQSKTQLHAWNLVKIDGDYYHVDSTWDDPVSENRKQTLQHTYFNLNDEEISVDHYWEIIDYPSCYSTKYNYFTYHQQEVTSPDEFIRFLIDRVENGESHISVRIANYTVESYQIPELIQIAVTELRSNVSYSINEAYGVVEVWIGTK